MQATNEHVREKYAEYGIFKGYRYIYLKLKSLLYLFMALYKYLPE